MSANATWYMVMDVLSALAATSAARILHRDLKPQNILRVPRAMNGGVQYVLADFGTMATNNGYNVDCVNDGREGTPAYLPPERYWSPSSETWQLGMLVLACRGGDVPPSGNLQELRDSGLYTHLLQVEWRFVEACLEPDAGNRMRPLDVRNHAVYYLDRQPEPKEGVPH